MISIKKSKLISLLAIVIVVFVAWFIWDGFIKDNTPIFFPINEQRGQYSIVKSQDDIFEVQYVGPGTFNNNNAISVIVGETTYDLNKYLGKKVLITKGKFVNGYKQQCIFNSCKDIGGPYVVIKIDELLEIK